MNVQWFSDDIVMNIAAGVSSILFTFLAFLFCIKLIGLLKRQEKVLDVAPITVLIPAYNEAKTIRNCLASLVACDYPKELLNIIVVNDESTDSTTKIARTFANEHKDVSICVISIDHAGKSAALNAGLALASTELVVTIDTDVRMGPDTLQKLVAPMKTENVGASNAVAVIHEPKRFLEFFQMIEFGLNNVIRSSFSRVFGNCIWFYGAVACYRKSALEAVGGFKQDSLTEDMDLSLELFGRGYNIVTVEHAVFATDAMSSVPLLFKQRMRWYYGALQSLWKHRSLLRERFHRPEVLFLFVNQWWWTVFAFVFFPLTVYQVWYWMPQATSEIILYLVRWFSLWGPFYVLWNIPNWGLSTLNIFGVLSGLITLTMSVTALIWFGHKKHVFTVASLFLYFPYTIILNAIVVSSVFRYMFSKKKYFIN